jgi:hypothetical protein
MSRSPLLLLQVFEPAYAGQLRVISRLNRKTVALALVYKLFSSRTTLLASTLSAPPSSSGWLFEFSSELG